MKFTKDSQTVKNFVFLINEGQRTLDEVPNLFNLREIVLKTLEESNENAN